MVRYFSPDIDVMVKVLKFKSLSRETAEIFSEYLLFVLHQNNLKEKKLLNFVLMTATQILAA